MGTWKTRGLRGSTLEDMINMTNESYREKGLALIQKIPTPITPINIDQSTRHITLHWNSTGDSCMLWCQGMCSYNISYDEYSRASG